MPQRPPRQDFSAIRTRPIAERENKFSIAEMLAPGAPVSFRSPELDGVAAAVRTAHDNDRQVVAMLGGAVVKEGCSLLLIELMKQGFITHLAVNGSVTIHDFEVAVIGATSEDVLSGLDDGSFGMAEETGRLMNEALVEGHRDGLGYGAAIGRALEHLACDNLSHSLLYQAYALKVPATVHVAIGGDIIHQHPACDGAALGATSYEDFRTLTDTMADIGGGVVLNIGSAVVMPEVFLKALTIARNLGHRHGDFTVANFDFLDMYRARTRVLEWPKALGATAFDVRGRHRETVAGLYGLVGGRW